MDQTQDQMKSLGTFGIVGHSFKTIFSLKKVFAQITFTLILPLTFIIIAHMNISKRFFSNIEQNPYSLILDACIFYQSYYDNIDQPGWPSYILFKMITIFLLIVLCLLSTSTVVYTVACAYTGRDITYQKAMRVIPKVWKRLVTTFLSMFLCFFNHALLSSVVFFLWRVVFWETYLLNIGFLALGCLYFLTFMDLAIYWQIASVISVLENGPRDVIMTKANNLMKGKKKVALTISSIIYLFFTGIVVMYMVFVFDDGPKMVLVWKVMIGIMCFVLLTITLLLMMVVQTVLYLVCKAHHGEVVDPVSLSTYLGAYLSDSQPPVFRVSEVIQLGRPQNRPMSQV